MNEKREQLFKKIRQADKIMNEIDICKKFNISKTTLFFALKGRPPKRGSGVGVKKDESK